jgi:hypothetical protein
MTSTRARAAMPPIVFLSLLLVCAAQVDVAAPGTRVRTDGNTTQVSAPFTQVWVEKKQHGTDKGDKGDKEQRQLKDGGDDGGSDWCARSPFKNCAELFHAELSGDQVVPPVNDTDASGHAWICVKDNNDKKATTILTRLRLCDIRGYISSHLHVAPFGEDFPPPIVAIEPPIKPKDPEAPPQDLPALKKPVDVEIDKCRVVQRMSGPKDLIVVEGGPPTWSDFLDALESGDVYVNAHTVSNPGGEIRGQFEKCGDDDGGDGGRRRK